MNGPNYWAAIVSGVVIVSLATLVLKVIWAAALKARGPVVTKGVRVVTSLEPSPTITSILLDCSYNRRYYIALGDEVDDPTQFKWHNDYDRALALARNMFEAFEGKMRVRIYDVDDGQFVYDAGYDETLSPT